MPHRALTFPKPHKTYKDYKDEISPDRLWKVDSELLSYIIHDLEEFGVPNNVVHDILIARGVYKAFSVRRRLIRMQQTILNRIIYLKGERKQITNKHGNSSSTRIDYVRIGGEIYACETIYNELRALCHSGRWQAPDNDKEAVDYLLSRLPKKKPG